MQSTPWKFIVSLIVFALSAATIIWLLPSWMDSSRDVQPWLLATLVGVALVSMLGIGMWRPHGDHSPTPRT